MVCVGEGVINASAYRGRPQTAAYVVGLHVSPGSQVDGAGPRAVSVVGAELAPKAIAERNDASARGVAGPVMCCLSPPNAKIALETCGPHAEMFGADRLMTEEYKLARAHGIVWEVSPDMLARPDTLPQVVLKAAGRAPLLLHVQLRTSTARLVVEAARSLPDVRLSLNGVSGDLSRELRRIIQEPAQRLADQTLLTSLAERLPDSAWVVLAGAVIAGRRRTSVSELSRLCGISSDTVENRLRASGAPPPRCVLGRTMALHVAWCCGVLGWPLKRAAWEAGFSNSATLSNYILRHAGVRPTELSRLGGFSGLLESFLDVRQSETTPRRGTRIGTV